MPAARTRYGLFDLVSLFCDLLAPILDPLFGGLDDAPVEPEPPPSADPLVVRCVAISSTHAEPVIVVGLPADTPTAELMTTPTENREANDAPAEPLYVARGEGRGRRYDVAGPGEPGQRYRMLVKGGKRRFTPLEA